MTMLHRIWLRTQMSNLSTLCHCGKKTFAKTPGLNQRSIISRTVSQLSYFMLPECNSGVQGLHTSNCRTGFSRFIFFDMIAYYSELQLRSTMSTRAPVTNINQQGYQPISCQIESGTIRSSRRVKRGRELWWLSWRHL